MRLVPRLQVLPRAWKVRHRDAGRGVITGSGGEVGVGSPAAGFVAKCRIPQLGDEASVGAYGEAVVWSGISNEHAIDSIKCTAYRQSCLQECIITTELADDLSFVMNPFLDYRTTRSAF